LIRLRKTDSTRVRRPAAVFDVGFESCNTFFQGGRKNDIDVGSCALVTMSGEGVSADQQVIDAVRIQRTQQRLQFLG
jgi:hypothetical protein